MSNAPTNSFNPAFLEQLKKKSQNTWKCPACYTYNDNKFNECRSCEAKKPGIPAGEATSVKRAADSSATGDEKKAKVTGFVFKPSGNAPKKSIFDNMGPKPSAFPTPSSFPSNFKFGVGPNSVTLNVPKPVQKEEEKKVEKIDKDEEDWRKYESDDDAHGDFVEKDYAEDENAEDVMDGRTEIPHEDCVTIKTVLSKNSDAYDVYVFGSGDCSQLGLDDDTSYEGKPVKHEVATSLHPTRAVCGGLFNVIVGSDRTSLYSWGCNDECGLGRDGEEMEQLPVNRGDLPKDDPIEQIVAGACHVAILTQAGRVFCWGTYRDSKGILGWSPTVKKQSNPTEIHFPRGVKVASLACGENHTLALTTDGKLYGWGSDEQGQLVNHMPEAMKHRALVPHAIAFREGRRKMKVKAVWAGGMHSMVKLENDHILAFGLNNWGQLGVGHRSEEVEKPERIPFLEDMTVCQAALSQHTTAILTATGEVYTCGRNSYGQLGRQNEKLEVDTVFGKVNFPGGVKIQQIAAGNHHFLAVDEKGLLYTWGFGEMFQLGNGKGEDEVYPYHVRSKELCDKRVVMVDGGAQHTIVLAKKL